MDMTICHRPDFLGEIAEKMSGYGICVASFDCEPKANQKICKAAGVTMIPHYNLYTEDPQHNPYTKKNFREYVHITGVTDEKTLEKGIGKRIPHNIKVISTESSADGLVSAGKSGAVILFTSKSTSSFVFRAQAFAFRSSLDFIQVKDAQDGTGLASTYGVSDVPSLGLLVNDQFTPYDGDLKSFGDIIAWVSEKSGVASATSEQMSSPASGAGGSGAGAGSSSVDVISATDVNALFVDGLSQFADDVAAYVVGIVPADGSRNELEWWEKLAPKCVGVVKCVQLLCSESGSISDETAAAVFCANSRPGGHAVVVPYAISSRKSVLTSLAKWSYPATAKSPVDVDAALKRAQESIPEDMIPVVTEVTLDSMILSPAFATGQAAIIALSNRPTPSALIRNAAAASKTFARMGFMSNPSPQFMAQLGNLPLPTVIGMMDGPEVDGQKNFQIMPYDPAVFGPINFHTLMAFIVNVDRQSTALRGGDSAESPGRVSPDKNGRDGPAILSEVSSADDWQKYCGDGFKGICAVGFMGAPAGVDPADAEAISVFQAAIDSMDLTSAYNFVWVDASCQTKLAEAFEVTGGATPALVVYSPLKNRFAKYVGSYAKDNMRSYLDSMAAGRVSTFPLSETPVYDSTVECLTAEALTSDTSSGDDFDADDFLAEMQKEEAERQAALKKSLEEERKAREADAKEKEKSKKKTKKKQKKSSKKKAEL